MLITTGPNKKLITNAVITAPPVLKVIYLKTFKAENCSASGNRIL
jgi:hypothetical protein